MLTSAFSPFLLSLLSLSSTCLAATIFKGDATFYSPSVGLGSCGHQDQDTSLVAALAQGTMRQYNPSNPNNNPLCGHKVRVWRQDKPGTTVTVAIRDTCPGCKGPFDLDLSPTAFKKLANPDVGRVKIAWEFVGPAGVKTGPFKGAVPAAAAAAKKPAVNQKIVAAGHGEENAGAQEEEEEVVEGDATEAAAEDERDEL
ncbi:MAG: hypothetical protein LQ350_006715 [Teloschistes chrysophthalmus]|nr:MAG: hypothetical protein LQ350_006715 [Niorma chrysophthalma]